MSTETAKMNKRGKKPRSTQSLVLTHLHIDLLESNTSNFERLIARAPRGSTIKAQNVKENKQEAPTHWRRRAALGAVVVVKNEGLDTFCH